jgi:hypothetical protein
VTTPADAHRKPRPSRAAAASLLLLATLGLTEVRCTPGPTNDARIEARKRALLQETDLSALRDACRAVILKYGSPGVKHLPLDDERIPPIVRRLEPKGVVLVQNYLRVEMGGPGLYYGVEAFRDRLTQVPHPTARELTDGLWYYETTGVIDRYPN